MRILVCQITAVLLMLFSFNIKSGTKDCKFCEEDKIVSSEEEIVNQIIDEKLDQLKKNSLEQLNSLKEEQYRLLRELHAIENNVHVYYKKQTNKIELWY